MDCDWHFFRSGCYRQFNKEKETPPTKTGSRVAEPLVDVEKRKACTRQIDPLKPLTKPRMLLGDIPTDDKAPRSMVDVNNTAPGITMAEALNLIMYIDGFKEYMLTRLCNYGVNSPGTGLYVRCPR